MPAMDEAFWANLDAQIIAQRPEDQGRVPGTSIQRAPQISAASVAAAPARRLASDWTGVLDTLTAAKSAAQQQDARLREKAAEQDALKQELKRSQQELRAMEVLLRECRAQAEAKLNEVQAETEIRVQDLKAEAAARQHAMDAQVRAAEQRADAAEEWLRRIEQASRDLMPVAERAAA